MKAGIEPDADVFDSVTDAATEEFAPQGAFQTDAATRADFTIDIAEALEIQVAIVDLGFQTELSAEEPGLDKGDDIILPLSADLNAQAKLLPAASESGRMKEVKIALADFDK